MLEFDWPWLVLALVLPLLALLLPARPRPLGSALRVPDASLFSDSDNSADVTRANTALWLTAFLAYTCLTLAAMRPVWVGDIIEMPLEGRDLMLAIDLSMSMREQDMVLGNHQISRINATKRVASEFVEKRKGDRLGLIVFGTNPYLQTPLTFDRSSINENILDSQPGYADNLQQRLHRTSIGDAIGLAVKRLRETSVKDKILILLTDGTDNHSKLPPLKAAELAARDGLKIYTIGIGSDKQSASLLGFNFNFGRRNEIDEETLKQIAELTGGRYFRARDTEELAEIYHIIDELEPVQSDVQYFRPRQALFFYPLGFSLLLAGLLILLHSIKGGHKA